MDSNAAARPFVLRDVVARVRVFTANARTACRLAASTARLVEFLLSASDLIAATKRRISPRRERATPRAATWSHAAPSGQCWVNELRRNSRAFGPVIAARAISHAGAQGLGDAWVVSWRGVEPFACGASMALPLHRDVVLPFNEVVMNAEPINFGSKSPASGNDRGRTVVVAEDDAEFRSFIAEALRRGGYRVVEAIDGTELLDLVKRLVLARPGAVGFDAIVSDNRMRGVTGLSVLRAFRLFDKTTPFMLMTAFSTEETQRDAAVRGANLILSKPFDIDVLLGALAIHLPRSQ